MRNRREEYITHLAAQCESLFDMEQQRLHKRQFDEAMRLRSQQIDVENQVIYLEDNLNDVDQYRCSLLDQIVRGL